MNMDIAAERSYPTPLANLTLLPMLLMSLMRQKNCPRTADIVKREYDYVIVGAGSAGSVVASRLSELPCVSVLLLEAGKSPPLLTDVPALARSFWFTDIDWQYKTVPQKRTGALLNNRQVVWPSGKAIGGSSILNGMLYVRGNKRNFDQWEAEGADGWSYKDVLPYFTKMEDNRDPEYVSNGYHGIRGPQTVHRPRYQPEMKDPVFKTAISMGYKVVDPNGPFQTGFYDLQSTMRAGQRCSTAKAYLVPAENRTNLDILPNAFVKKVLIKKRRAVGVQFDYEGQTYIVNAKREVILSAGTVNTAQLLMLSGIGPRRELERFKIPVIADLPVGKNLQDHCSSNVDFELDPSIQPSMEKLINPESIAQYIQNRTGPLGSSEFFNTIAFLRNKITEPDVDFPDHEISISESSSGAGLLFGLTPEAQAQIYEPYQGKPFYSCFSGPLHPRSRGTVTLQSDDPYDPPLIDPNYFDDPRDMDDLVEGLKVCNRIGNSPEMKRVGSVPRKTLIPGCEKYAQNEDLYLRCQVRSIIATASHPVGTCRMGNPRDPRAVVDSQLRVKTLQGLRVVDASVMPIIPSGNINAATIMVAEKASDIIKSTIRCQIGEDDDDSFPILEEIAFSGGPINFTQSFEKQSQNKDNFSRKPYTNKNPEGKRKNASFNKKEWNSDLKSQEITSQSKKSISITPHISDKVLDKPQYGYIPLENKELWNSDLHSSKITSHTADSASVASNKSANKPQYGYIPFKSFSKAEFPRDKDFLSSDPWNQEMLSPDFTNFLFSSNKSFFQTDRNPFNLKKIQPYVKQLINVAPTTESSSQTEPVSNGGEGSKIPQKQSTSSSKKAEPKSIRVQKTSPIRQATPKQKSQPKPTRPQKVSPVREEPKKTVTQSGQINSSKNANKKRLPSKFDSLRVKVGKQNTYLLSVEGNGKNSFQKKQENEQRSVPNLKADLPAKSPNSEVIENLDSEIYSDSQTDFDSDGSQSDSESDIASISLSDDSPYIQTDIRSNSQTDISSDAQSEINSNSPLDTSQKFQSDVNKDSQSDINKDSQSDLNEDSPSDVRSDYESDTDGNVDQTSSCETDFCNSLLNFTNCEGTKSCQKKIEFAFLLFQLLCNNE